MQNAGYVGDGDTIYSEESQTFKYLRNYSGFILNRAQSAVSLLALVIIIAVVVLYIDPYFWPKSIVAQMFTLVIFVLFGLIILAKAKNDDGESQ